jgi:hypothetical protein
MQTDVVCCVFWIAELRSARNLAQYRLRSPSSAIHKAHDAHSWRNVK